MSGFPSSTGSTQQTLADGLANARSSAASIKAQAQSLLAQIAAGPVSAAALIAIPGYAAQWVAALNACAALPGMATYAQAQVGNATLDVAAAFNAMVSAIQAVGSWITTNTPKDGSGNLLVMQYGGSGALVYATFTSGQLAGLVTALNALVATID
jgi:hypothetical protein